MSRIAKIVSRIILHPEEFSDLVESINKASYGILGKKGLLMDDSEHKNP